MSKYKLLFFVTMSLFLSLNEIQAYDCPCVTFADEFKNSAAVFSGKVISQEYKRATSTLFPDPAVFEVLQVKLKVDRWWKGSGETEVIVQPGGARVSGHILSGGDDFIFYPDGSYLVYAKSYNKALRADDCSRTIILSSAGEDLKLLGEGFLPKPVIESDSPEQFYSLLFGSLDIKVAVAWQPAMSPAGRFRLLSSRTKF